MKDQIVNLILVSIFWFSFFVPGKFIFDSFTKKYGDIKADFFEKLFWYFFGTAAVLTPFIILSYVLKLGLWFLAGAYGILFITALTSLIIKNRGSFKDFFSGGTEVAFRVDLLFVLLGLILISDFLLSGYMGGYIPWDAFVHTGKINKIIENGFSVADPFFKGLVDPRYHVNIIHALYAIPGKLAGLKAVDIWQNSLPFFRMMIWLSVYTIANKFFEKKEFSFFATVLAVIFFSNWLLYANYPNNIVYLWVTAFVVGLYLYFSQKNPGSLVILGAASLLVTLTHPTYAIGLMLFLPFMALLMLVAKKISFRESLQLVPMGALLAIGPAISFFMPNNMSDKVASYGLKANTLMNLFGGLYMIRPVVIYPAITALTIFGIAIIFFSRELQSEKKIMIIGSFAFPFLTLHNPVLLPLLNEVFPIWMIMAFRNINIFSKVVLFLPYFFVLGLIFRGRLLKPFFAIGLTMFVGWFLFANFARPYTLYEKRAEFRYSYYVSQEIASFSPKLEENKVILSDYWTSFNIPSVLNNYVITMYEDNASPAADMKRNFEIEKAAFSNNQEKFMSAVRDADASYLLVKKEDLPKFENVKGLIREVSVSNRYVLYSVGGAR